MTPATLRAASSASCCFAAASSSTSPYKEFGGLSSIRLSADGAQFIAVSDKGRWFRGRILYRNGRPEGIADAEMAPVLGPDGRPITARGWYDTEALAQDGGTLYVGLERVHQILRFDYGRDGLLARGQPIAVPPGLKRLPSNKGIECLAFVPKGLVGAGTLIAISERALDAEGHIKAFLLGGGSAREFSVARSDDFDITDCALTPRGELLLLERRFFWTSGVAMRIRRIALTSVKPGARVDGPVVVEADMGYQIDNMEGLSVHRTPDNRARAHARVRRQFLDPAADDSTAIYFAGAVGWVERSETHRLFLIPWVSLRDWARIAELFEI